MPSQPAATILDAAPRAAAQHHTSCTTSATPSLPQQHTNKSRSMSSSWLPSRGGTELLCYGSAKGGAGFFLPSRPAATSLDGAPRAAAQHHTSCTTTSATPSLPQQHTNKSRSMSASWLPTRGGTELFCHGKAGAMQRRKTMCVCRRRTPPGRCEGKPGKDSRGHEE